MHISADFVQTRRCQVALSVVFLFAALNLGQANPIAFVQTNLVSSVPGLAALTDPHLKNPWGVSHSPASPFWVSNQVTGTATLYNGAGQPFPASPLVVNIPSFGQPAGPTAQAIAIPSSHLPARVLAAARK